MPFFGNPEDNHVYTIELADGTVLNNLGLNGNNFVSALPLTEEDFQGKLSRVTITDETDDRSFTLEHGKLEHLTTYDNGETYYFVLGQISSQELQFMQIQASLEYMAMMTDIDL